jgi:D-alanyl-lipoteichoic acid acyltransferase DltB (MBOAT superfamily)
VARGVVVVHDVGGCTGYTCARTGCGRGRRSIDGWNSCGRASVHLSLDLVLFTFHLVCFSWAFFRITDFREALLCAGRIFTWTRPLQAAQATFRCGFSLWATG